jgi:hypothetical protein
LKWYTTCKLYLEEFKKETNNLIDEKMKMIREQQKEIVKTIKQKKHNIIANNKKQICEIKIEKDVLTNIQSMPQDIINHIAQYAFTPENKLAIYKKTDTEIKNYVDATKLQLLHPFLKIIKTRANTILNSLERKQSKTSPFKPSDYNTLKNIRGTTKSQIKTVLLNTIQCYNYLLCITNNFTGHKLFYAAIENELLYIHKTITYIARPEMNKRTKLHT